MVLFLLILVCYIFAAVRRMLTICMSWCKDMTLITLVTSNLLLIIVVLMHLSAYIRDFYRWSCRDPDLN